MKLSLSEHFSGRVFFMCSLHKSKLKSLCKLPPLCKLSFADIMVLYGNFTRADACPAQ